MHSCWFIVETFVDVFVDVLLVRACHKNKQSSVLLKVLTSGTMVLSDHQRLPADGSCGLADSDRCLGSEHLGSD